MKWIDNWRAAIAKEKMKSAIALWMSAEEALALIRDEEILEKAMDEIDVMIDKLESKLL